MESGRVVDAVERRMWLTDGMWTLREKKNSVLRLREVEGDGDCMRRK